MQRGLILFTGMTVHIRGSWYSPMQGGLVLWRVWRSISGPSWQQTSLLGPTFQQSWGEGLPPVCWTTPVDDSNEWNSIFKIGSCASRAVSLHSPEQVFCILTHGLHFCIWEHAQEGGFLVHISGLERDFKWGITKQKYPMRNVWPRPYLNKMPELNVLLALLVVATFVC